VPVLLKDVARSGLARSSAVVAVSELDGDGEAVGAVIVLRSGANARATIQAVQAKLDALKPGLPEGVEIVTTYDRSALIDQLPSPTCGKSSAREFLVVVLVCAVFHPAPAVVAGGRDRPAPRGAGGVCVMRAQGINANINVARRHRDRGSARWSMPRSSWSRACNRHLEGGRVSREDRWRVVAETAAEVGPALFFSARPQSRSVFLPVFVLEAQEGRLFKPLAFTKTYAMAAAAVLSVTLVPVLMGYLVRGRIVPERTKPAERRPDRDLSTDPARGSWRCRCSRSSSRP